MNAEQFLELYPPKNNYVIPSTQYVDWVCDLDTLSSDDVKLVLDAYARANRVALGTLSSAVAQVQNATYVKYDTENAVKVLRLWENEAKARRVADILSLQLTILYSLAASRDEDVMNSHD